jgi:hypothetical protein
MEAFSVLPGVAGERVHRETAVGRLGGGRRAPADVRRPNAGAGKRAFALERGATRLAGVPLADEEALAFPRQGWAEDAHPAAALVGALQRCNAGLEAGCFKEQRLAAQGCRQDARARLSELDARLRAAAGGTALFRQRVKGMAETSSAGLHGARRLVDGAHALRRACERRRLVLVRAAIPAAGQEQEEEGMGPRGRLAW